MNDQELQRAVRDAFDAIEVPEDVKQAALAAVEARRVQEEGAPQPKARVRAMAGGRRMRTWLAAAACLAALVFGVGGVAAYAMPVAYVGIDVNPSVELQLNRFDVVVGTHAINDDGAAVLSSADVVGKSYQEALDILDAAAGTLLPDDSYVVISVTAGDAGQAGRLEDSSNRYLQQSGHQGSCQNADEQAREEAHAAGVGVGKYQAIQQLHEADASYGVENCSDLTMRQLRDLLEEEGQHLAGSGNGQGRGQAANQEAGDCADAANGQANHERRQEHSSQG